LLVRDGEPGGPPEVLMVRRNLDSVFVAGAYIFPGGAVDEADGQPEAQDRCRGRDDAGASALLGLAEGGLAYWVAALRECFEEAGVLLADGPDGKPVSFADPAVEARFKTLRHELNSGQRTFADVCAAEDLVLATDRVHYLAHWVTPEGPPRRYDTRFFVAPAPADQTPVHDDHELIECLWLTPAAALERHRRGRLELILPTIATLSALTRFGSAADLLGAAVRAEVDPRPPTQVVLRGRGTRIGLPGDPGYPDDLGVAG
jgi:8-oxo-dGTP pyrophosphatase MutT (NUDIX family)